MKSVRHITKGKFKGDIELNGIKYRPYKVGELPKKFAYIYDDAEESDGITLWFNRGGFTYVIDERS